ncbi:MAG: PAS domain S-box protein [Verrucomicrobia bacterium]|nr:PAS domain S-box protein [Verrucomicrobiota bacterium]
MATAKILIVEDEILVARELEARLRSLGYAIAGVALSGEEALRAASELQPDIVLVDIVLKGPMDGIAVADEMRTRLDLPVVYVTAYADESTVRRAKVTQPYGYIVKPFSDSEVYAAVEIALYKHQIERKLREAQEAGLLLAAIMESSPDAIVGWTLAGTVFSWNPGAENLYGYSATEALGQCMATLMVPPDRHNEIPQIVERIEQGERVEGYETVRVRKDGTVVAVSLTVSPIRNSAGEIVGAATVGRRIGGAKREKERLPVGNEARAAEPSGRSR